MSWFERTADRQRAFAEEGLVLDAAELVAKAMEERGISQAQLARLLEVKDSEITQRLRGKRNLTLRTLASMMNAMNFDVRLVKRDRLAVTAAELSWDNSSFAGEISSVAGRGVRRFTAVPGGDTLPVAARSAGAPSGVVELRLAGA
jgi:transcriptional regulator with XRE-family HTH domain